VPDLELELDTAHSLEEALLKQMEMQKKLHEQLEVRAGLQKLLSVLLARKQCACSHALASTASWQREHLLAASKRLKTNCMHCTVSDLVLIQDVGAADTEAVAAVAGSARALHHQPYTEGKHGGAAAATARAGSPGAGAEAGRLR
jgi:hypothetical protein